MIKTRTRRRIGFKPTLKTLDTEQKHLDLILKQVKLMDRRESNSLKLVGQIMTVLGDLIKIVNSLDSRVYILEHPHLPLSRHFK